MGAGAASDTTVGPTRAAARGSWFPAIDADATPPAPTRARPAFLVVCALAVALLAVGVARGVALRTLLPVALALGALATLTRWRGRPLARPASESRRGLSLEARDLVLISASGARQPVVPLEGPFGATLVATRGRDRVVLAVSSSAGVFYVGATFDAAARQRFASLLGKAAAIATDDAGLEAIAPDGAPLDLVPASLAALVDALAARDGSCLDRVILSDARGAPCSIDGHEFSVAGVKFELSSPLEWRAFVFQESFGQAVAVYQATWVKQGASEVVLVSLLPSLVPARDVRATGIPEIDRATVRDLRLTQAAPDDPPPPERRVAIDRLFMLPVRVALDKAPRPSHQPEQPRA
jgi:hypothetical protein